MFDQLTKITFNALAGVEQSNQGGGLEPLRAGRPNDVTVKENRHPADKLRLAEIVGYFEIVAIRPRLQAREIIRDEFEQMRGRTIRIHEGNEIAPGSLNFRGGSGIWLLPVLARHPRYVATGPGFVQRRTGLRAALVSSSRLRGA